MGGKRKIDPATGQCMKYPSDMKRESKPRTTEQNAARKDPATGRRRNSKYPSDFKKRKRKPRTTEQNAARNKKGMDGGKFRPNKNTLRTTTSQATAVAGFWIF